MKTTAKLRSASQARSLPRREFLRTSALAALAMPFLARDLRAAPRSQLVRHAAIGAGNQAARDLEQLTRHPSLQLVAIADVDEKRSAPWRERFPDARVYTDWRELLEKEKELDSVNVATPDHMHAPIAMSAMQLGRHVYVQKPLAHDLFEVRELTRFAHSRKLVTQMGIQIHSSSEYRQAVQVVQSGVIGKVKEVHSWCGKTWGDPNPRPDREESPPPELHWDLWLGTAAARPYIGQGYYHPMNWRNRLDFGTGTFGDMGCHIFDPVFGALDLEAPTSVRSEGAAPNAWNWAPNSQVHYVFPGNRHTDGRTLKVSWYDGSQLPPPEILSFMPTESRPRIGSIFIGTKGAMVLPHVGRARLYPESKFVDFKLPKVEDGNHYLEFIEAVRGRAKAGARFDYSGPLTEAVLLGGVASHFPQTTLEWNSRALKVRNIAAANDLLRREYRPGWRVRGLS